MVVNSARDSLEDHGGHTVRQDIERALREVPAGASGVPLSPGRVVPADASALRTVAFVVIELETEVCESIYEYIHSVQTITHRLRPVIVTDSDDLRAIRRFSWFTEHLMSRSAFLRLEPAQNWGRMIVDRVLATARRLDVLSNFVADVEGPTREQHYQLMSALEASVPFDAVAFRPGAAESRTARDRR